MRAVIQRVDNASVIVDDKEVASIEKGLLVLVGIHTDDTQADREKIISKLLKLRLFPDGNKEFDKSVVDSDNQLLLVSQFTLFVDCHKGNRPSFSAAMPPKEAAEFYEKFVSECVSAYPKTQSGLFGALMKVSLVNNGPVTIILDSQDRL